MFSLAKTEKIVPDEKVKSHSPFTSFEIPEESHSYVPNKAYYQGLPALFADWMIPNGMTTNT